MNDRWRVFVVDDEDDTRRVIRLALANKYEIVEARDGLEALDKIEDVEPDFIIMDVMMPLMDGYQATEAIRKIPKYSNIQVLFLSALTKKEAIKKGYASGANLYLTKPFDPIRLLRNVDLFFKQTPPPKYRKRHTLRELHEKFSKPQQPVQDSPETDKEEIKHPAPKAEEKPAQSPLDKGEVAIKPRIMVVDDDPEIVEVAKLALKNDFEVVHAQNGLEAIEKIVGYEPDIILLDALMPKLSGYQLCQSLRRNPKYLTTPIIFISVKSSPKDRDYARQLGANAFVPKPFEPYHLVDVVQEFISDENFEIRPKKLGMNEILKREREIQRERQTIEQRRLEKDDFQNMREILKREMRE